MPARYRDYLATLCAGNLVLTIDPTNSVQEPCLLLYPLPEWEQIQQRIDALSSFNPASRKVQRLLVGHADDVHMDGNGRLLLSPELRKFAQMDKKVVLIGQGKKFELWDDATWQACREGWLDTTIADTAVLPAELSDLSL